ncbi:hypothetical protein EBS02_07955 [bacterium]|nr:hypothetical protein [bacterium]
MNLLFSEVLEQVDKLKSKEEKIGFLRKHGHAAYKGIFRINFDESVSMNLPEGEPPFRKEGGKPIGYQETNLIQEFRRFYIWLDPKQNLTKIRKEKLFIEMLEGLHVSEAEVLCLAKDRKIQKKYKSINYEIVREAFPDLLPIKEKKEKTVPLS